jgi:hypothetical protein
VHVLLVQLETLAESPGLQPLHCVYMYIKLMNRSVWSSSGLLHVRHIIKDELRTADPKRCSHAGSESTVFAGERSDGSRHRGEQSRSETDRFLCRRGGVRRATRAGTACPLPPGVKHLLRTTASRPGQRLAGCQEAQGPRPSTTGSPLAHVTGR